MTMSRNIQTLSPIFCQECRRPWLDGAERWRVYLTDDAPAEPVPYCVDCARREFDPDGHADH